MIGKAGRSTLAPLVERTSRYTLSVALPPGRRDATTTSDALISPVAAMPAEPVKTSPGSRAARETAAHAAFTLATTVEVYFAYPHSPSERGTNESTDDQTHLDLVARELNRPRRILGYRAPAEVFADLLASVVQFAIRRCGAGRGRVSSRW